MVASGLRTVGADPEARRSAGLYSKATHLLVPFREIPATFVSSLPYLSGAPIVAALYLVQGKGFVSLLCPRRVCGSSALSNLIGWRHTRAKGQNHTAKY